jgi:predicted CopG family antitoxin
MGHKTITISDDAYEALAKAKTDNESFTKVILRLTSQRTTAGALLDYLQDSLPDEDLAASIEERTKTTKQSRLTRADL